MKWRILIAALLGVFLVAGCDRIQKLSSGGGEDDKSASAPQKIEKSPATDDSGAEVSGAHNAVTEGEDDASRARRNKARASLGLGGGGN